MIDGSALEDDETDLRHMVSNTGSFSSSTATDGESRRKSSHKDSGANPRYSSGRHVSVCAGCGSAIRM